MTGPRENAHLILRELDLRTGDVVVDIGAGCGWWESVLADELGTDGVVYAAEIRPHLVDDLTREFAGTPQVKPLLVDTDGTGLATDTCDVALFIHVYHHLSNHAQYLRHLRDVVKPTGRIVIVDRHARPNNRFRGLEPSELSAHAAESGWIPVRCRPIRDDEHYVATFVRDDLFDPHAS